jgi:ABC-type bacteriocin/lantibiotic exporter with double-glycine peptidase domain
MGEPIELDRVAHCIKFDARKRTSMKELVDGLEALGLSARGVRMGRGTLAHLDAPMILFLQPGHFVAALPDGAGRVITVDPPSKPKARAVRELREWSGEAVLVAEDPDKLAHLCRRLHGEGREL